MGQVLCLMTMYAFIDHGHHKYKTGRNKKSLWFSTIVDEFRTMNVFRKSIVDPFSSCNQSSWLLFRYWMPENDWLWHKGEFRYYHYNYTGRENPFVPFFVPFSFSPFFFIVFQDDGVQRRCQKFFYGAGKRAGGIPAQFFQILRKWGKDIEGTRKIYWKGSFLFFSRVHANFRYGMQPRMPIFVLALLFSARMLQSVYFLSSNVVNIFFSYSRSCCRYLENGKTTRAVKDTWSFSHILQRGCVWD